MTTPKSVAVIGLGLMGGSLARDLSARTVRVLGFDSRSEVLSSACAEGIVQQPLQSDLIGISDAELIVLATPVDVALDIIPLVAERVGPDAVVTDVGSAKAAIGARAEALGLGHLFVGSHPLAGDHRSGWSAARRGLYEGVPVFVCPTPASSASALRRVLDLWSGLGASPMVQDPAEHDRRMASISHLPQIIASALAAVLGDQDIAPRDLGPGGRDMTRLAASSPEMWTAICQANSENLLVALHRLQAHLSSAQEAIGRADSAELLDFFRRSRQWLA